MEVGYIRVSTVGQDLATQEQYMKDKGVTKVFGEKRSGSEMEERKALQECIDFVREGDILHVSKLDRLARNTKDALTVLEQLLKKNITVVFGDIGTVDNTPAGKLVFTMFSAFAEFERNRILERTNEGREKAKKKGVQFGQPKKTKLSPVVRHWIEEVEKGTISQPKASEMAGVSLATFKRHLKKYREGEMV
ncbi:recombinase family protein [Bacillus massiliigorillae]|uniref:recombinase family protein n=1 Tax=Bacillus massiliigorillae TaxID=1243664 RepID=UPI0003A3EB87|nr:recombinase family protein [Bacillus massiliigorillae]